MISVQNRVRLIVCDTQAEADGFKAGRGDILIVKGASYGGLAVQETDKPGFFTKRTDEYAIHFNNSKNGQVTFAPPYDKVPYVFPVPLDTSATPVARTSVTKAGCTVKLQSNFTGTIQLTVKER